MKGSGHMGERYTVGKDPNTKDWFVYDNETNQYVCRCDTETEAIEFIKGGCNYGN